MWNRKEIKMRGKDKFRLNYWKCVLAALILSLVTGGGAVASGSISSGIGSSAGISGGASGFSSSGLSTEHILMIVGIVMFIALFVGIIAFAVRIFALNPLMEGSRTFALETSRGTSSLKNLGSGFTGGYWRVVKTLLINDVFLLLWSLLFIVPGIIKSYSYRMVPYIIADNPDISGTEAITRSRQMMNGHKWRTFVLDLSFILWDLLSAITCGVVGALYVEPYKMQTDAELYEAIKSQSAA